MDNTKKILFVDDDQNLLDACKRQLRKRFRIETRAGPELGLTALANDRSYAVVVSDMRMPGMDGVQFLSQVRALAPDTIRMMLTGYPDLETAIEAVNQGSIFRFLTKPCSPDNLVQALEAGLEQHQLLRNQSELLEMKLRHAQKMELVGQCAAGAVHDLRNILGIINLQTGMMLEDEAGNDRVAEPLRQIQDAASNAARLTQQLVGVARKQQQNVFAPVDLAKLLQDLSAMLRHILPKSIRLRCECPQVLLPVHGDSGMLGQVILNLALNARDAMPLGGHLLLAAEPVAAEAATPPPQVSKNYSGLICLMVTDTGCGMTRAIQQRLFEPFFTTKLEGNGTGLGLCVVADIVKQHGGWMQVRSEPDKGSTFQAFLPVHTEPPGMEP